MTDQQHRGPKPLFVRHLLARFAMALKRGNTTVGVMAWELRRAGLSEADLVDAYLDGRWAVVERRGSGELILERRRAA